MRGNDTIFSRILSATTRGLAALALLYPVVSHWIAPGQPPRSYLRSRIRYMPHQGKQECARRVRQMQKAGKP